MKCARSPQDLGNPPGAVIRWLGNLRVRTCPGSSRGFVSAIDVLVQELLIYLPFRPWLELTSSISFVRIVSGFQSSLECKMRVRNIVITKNSQLVWIKRISSQNRIIKPPINRWLSISRNIVRVSYNRSVFFCGKLIFLKCWKIFLFYADMPALPCCMSCISYKLHQITF